MALGDRKVAQGRAERGQERSAQRQHPQGSHMPASYKGRLVHLRHAFAIVSCSGFKHEKQAMSAWLTFGPQWRGLAASQDTLRPVRGRTAIEDCGALAVRTADQTMARLLSGSVRKKALYVCFTKGD
ncbi:hypothetical protein MBLNU459_g2785t1 [Dothideomycetes sp. NU459]